MKQEEKEYKAVKAPIRKKEATGVLKEILEEVDKELLLKDLSARLPYGVKVQFKLPDHRNKVFTEEIGELQSINKYGEVSINSKGIDYRFIQLDCKPYLRPMSSMTKEEINTLKGYIDDPYEQIAFSEDGMRFNGRNSFVVPYKVMSICIDFCYSHHLDFRGLIQKGIALEAKEGMYKFE